MNKNTILKSRLFFYVLQKIINIDSLNNIKIKQNKSKEKNNNNKKSNNEKIINNDISNIKFANMTNRKSLKIC